MAKIPSVRVIDVGAAKPVTEQARRQLTKEHKLAANDRKMREKLVPAPPPLKPGDEADWVTERLAALEPYAVREIEQQLLYSRDSRERRSAADKILDANGHGKREATHASTGPIIVINGVTAGQMPWQLQQEKDVTPNASIQKEADSSNSKPILSK